MMLTDSRAYYRYAKQYSKSCFVLYCYDQGVVYYYGILRLPGYDGDQHAAQSQTLYDSERPVTMRNRRTQETLISFKMVSLRKVTFSEVTAPKCRVLKCWAAK